MDIAAPSIIIGQAIGRWGNFVNQEAHGVQILDPAWQWFPAGVQIDGLWYQATFFYESMWNLIVFITLILLRKRLKIRGGIFALYIVLYGFGRFWIESLRTDSLMLGTFRISQVLSLLLFVGGIVYLVIMARKKKELLAYDGVYSTSWSREQVREYKENVKREKAEKKRKQKDTQSKDNQDKADTDEAKEEKKDA